MKNYHHMKNTTPDPPFSTKIKWTMAVFLFFYFGFMIIPEWSHPFFSGRFILWASTLPIVLIILIVAGIRAGIGLWREKTQKLTPDPNNSYLVLLAGLGILWFAVSFALTGVTYNAYFHKKFDPKIWKATDGLEGSLFEQSARERMMDDLTANVLPKNTRTNVLNLLGMPDREYDSEDLVYFYKLGIMDPECLFIVFDDKDYFQEFYFAGCE